jgi:hypothetical protein
LGTISGLVRFDGVRFIVFDESNTPQLGSGRLLSCLKTAAHVLLDRH